MYIDKNVYMQNQFVILYWLIIDIMNELLKMYDKVNKL